MGEWSPENIGGAWQGGGRGQVGDHFLVLLRALKARQTGGTLASPHAGRAWPAWTLPGGWEEHPPGHASSTAPSACGRTRAGRCAGPNGWGPAGHQGVQRPREIHTAGVREVR
jgi:hypothetical protein